MSYPISAQAIATLLIRVADQQLMPTDRVFALWCEQGVILPEERGAVFEELKRRARLPNPKP